MGRVRGSGGRWMRAVNKIGSYCYYYLYEIQYRMMKLSEISV